MSESEFMVNPPRDPGVQPLNIKDMLGSNMLCNPDSRFVDWPRQEDSASCQKVGARSGWPDPTPEGHTSGLPPAWKTHTGVCEKQQLLRIRRQVGNSASRTPNLGLDCSLCCWVAWPRLKLKECFMFPRHRYRRPLRTRPVFFLPEGIDVFHSHMAGESLDWFAGG